jgi:hypothetical protein
MKAVALATVLAGFVVLAAAAQAPRDPQSAPSAPAVHISGRVIAEQTGDPIPNARVTPIGARTFPFYVAVVSRLPVDGDDAWQEPAYLDSLMPRASTVSFAEGDSKTMTLTQEAR